MIIFALSYIPSPLIDMNNYYRISSLLPFAFQSVCYALDVVAMHPEAWERRNPIESSSFGEWFTIIIVHQTLSTTAGEESSASLSPRCYGLSATFSSILEPTMLLKSRYEKLKFLSSWSYPGWRLMPLLLYYVDAALLTIHLQLAFRISFKQKLIITGIQINNIVAKLETRRSANPKQAKRAM